jgi:hypothetical protein
MSDEKAARLQKALTAEEKIRRLQRALDVGGPTHRLSDVIEALKDGKAKLWEQDDGCIITEIHDFPLLKAAHYWTISGTLRDCLALDERICDWARGEGCTIATACGRRGWERVSAPYGWRPWHGNFVKHLGGD